MTRMLLGLTLCLVISAVVFGDILWRFPVSGLSMYFGVVALIAMSVAQIIACRVRMSEWILGPLDQQYYLHKWLAFLAVAAMFLHDSIDAEIAGLNAPFGLKDIGKLFGEWGYYGVLILVATTLATFIPYHLWKLTHKFMGFVFLLSFCHFLLMPKPFSLGSPTGITVLFFCTSGLLAYIVTLFRDKLTSVWMPYQVKQIESSGSATSLILEPVDQHMRHKPGQFAFLRSDLVGFQEAHPFTISNAPNARGLVRFTIKSLGDYTSKLNDLFTVGSFCHVQGAFGRFFPICDDKEQIWIAAGIGITPFLAWLDDTSFGSKADIQFFVTVYDKSHIPHLAELHAHVERHPNIHLHVVETYHEDRLNVEKMCAHIKFPNRCRVYYCGPQEWGKILKKNFLAKGVPVSSFHHEYFVLRSGIDKELVKKALVVLEYILTWMMRRIPR